MTTNVNRQEIFNNGNIISVPSKVIPYQKGIGSILFEKLSENGEYVGQIDGVSGESDTFGSMLQRSVRTAIEMRSRGVTSDDVVAVCSYNHFDTNIPIIASLFLGAKTASTDPALSLSDTVFLLNQVQPKMIFVSTNSVKLIEDAVKEIGINCEIVVFGNTKTHSRFSDFLKESPVEETFRPVEVTNIKETASIFFSSGTSGLPKGICLSHLSLLAQILHFDNTRGTLTFLTYSSPYWASSIIFLINSIINKARRLVLRSFDSDKMWSLIERYQVSVMQLAPIQLAKLSDEGRPEGVSTSSLLLAVTGGSPLTRELIWAAKQLFPTTALAKGYGQTELGGRALNFNMYPNTEDWKLALEQPAFSGRPMPGRSYKIVDPDTEEILGVNQQGELRVKTEYQMNGYYNLDSSKEWDCDGFLKTGDIAYYDEEYRFYIIDRIKEMLKYQRFQITPAKLEAILMAHPAVQTAVVIGLPHPPEGDHIMGIVVLKKSEISSGVTSEEIRQYVDDRVDDRQRLRAGVKIVESLPVTPSGKFSRRYAKDLVLQGKI